MNRTVATLMGAVATLVLATPSFALNHKDRAVVEQYREKIAAARAEPGVAEMGATELDEASAELLPLADALDHHKARDVAHITADIDLKLQTARTRAHAAMARHDAAAIGEAKAEAADARAAAADQAQAASQAQADAAAAQNDAAAARQENDQLRQQMAAYQMKQTQLGATLVLQDVVFETGKADLKPGAAERLRPLATYLQQNPSVHVRIDGHTDSQGSGSFNQQLSQARASAVASALSSMGVDPSRIQAVGHGEADPVATNATEAGRQENRRVEVTLVGQPASQFAGM